MSHLRMIGLAVPAVIGLMMAMPATAANRLPGITSAAATKTAPAPYPPPDTPPEKIDCAAMPTAAQQEDCRRRQPRTGNDTLPADRNPAAGGAVPPVGGGTGPATGG